jgi:ER membrane protein complex subunit 7
MKLQLPTILASLALSSLSTAARLHFSIPSSTIVPAPASLPSSTILTLTDLGKTFTAHLQRDNTFLLRNVPDGSYVLDIICKDYEFNHYRVDVSGDSTSVWQSFQGNEWENKGPQLSGSPFVSISHSPRRHKLTAQELLPKATKNYYEARQGFSPASLLKNPMILLAIVSLGLMVGIPYMIENMDPEMKAEFEESQRSGKIGADGPAMPTNPLKDFDMATWMAGKTAPSGASTPTSGGGGKKRG